jgi:glycosyltransferase involved in cell wall biosynthesis
MRIFILPSWCPTVDQPLSGTFFVEQANAIAQLRPDWTVAICSFDLSRSRAPWRIWQMPRFVWDWWTTPQLTCEVNPSGLHEYKAWAPYLPRFGSQRKWSATATALALQVQPALEDYIRRFGKPDLIHAHAVYPAGVAAVALGQEYGLAVGLTEHMGPFPPPTLCMPSGLIMPLLKDTFAALAQCSAVSQALASRIIELGLAKQVDVLHNFLPDDFGSVEENEGDSRESFTFLSVGGPSFAKGTDVLLQAMTRVSDKAKLKIAGDSMEKPVFEQMVAELNLTNRVQWLGALPRSQMPKQYQECDAFVLPSRGETFGIAFIEALASGKPIVATRCGGPEDIVHDGNGVLVPISNVDELALAMNDMVGKKGSYSHKLLRSDFLARFSATTAIERLETWYQKIVSNNQHEVAH